MLAEPRCPISTIFATRPRFRAAALHPAPPAMCSNQRLDQRLVAPRLPCRCRHVMISFRPPRRCSRIGMRMVRVSTSRPTRSVITLRPPATGRTGPERERPGPPAPRRGCGFRRQQRDGDAVGSDVDPLDQQPQDARLLGRVELVPHRLERAEGVDHVPLLCNRHRRLISMRLARNCGMRSSANTSSQTEPAWKCCCKRATPDRGRVAPRRSRATVS